MSKRRRMSGRERREQRRLGRQPLSSTGQRLALVGAVVATPFIIGILLILFVIEGDEDMNGRPCFVVERYPVDKKSGYTRQIVWVDQAEYRPEKIEYYDRKDELLKTLTFEGYQQYEDQFWRADKMHMTNHQTGKSTTLVWSGYKFKNGLSDREFDKASLKRAR